MAMKLLTAKPRSYSSRSCEDSRPSLALLASSAIRACACESARNPISWRADSLLKHRLTGSRRRSNVRALDVWLMAVFYPTGDALQMLLDPRSHPDAIIHRTIDPHRTRLAPMQPDHRPYLRTHVQRLQDPRDPHHGYLVDGLRQQPDPMRLPLQEFLWLEWFDGQRTLRDIQAAAMRRIGGYLIPLERFAELARRLDDALLLDAARW